MSLLLLLYLTIAHSPSENVSITGIHLSLVFLFFPLLFFFVFSVFSFFAKSNKQGILAAIFCSLYLLLRLNNLTHPFFLVLLLAIFLTLELLFKKN